MKLANHTYTLQGMRQAAGEKQTGNRRDESECKLILCFTTCSEKEAMMDSA